MGLEADVVSETDADHDSSWEHAHDEEGHGGFHSKDGDKQLVAVHGANVPKVNKHSAGHWLLSMALFVVMMATLSVVAIHFMQKCNAEKAALHDPEYTPLISDKV